MITLDQLEEFLAEGDLGIEATIRIHPKPWCVRVWALDDPADLQIGQGETLVEAVEDAIACWKQEPECDDDDDGSEVVQ